MKALSFLFGKSHCKTFLLLLFATAAYADNWNIAENGKIWSGTGTTVGIGFPNAATLPAGSDKLISLGGIVASDGAGLVRLLGEPSGSSVQFGKVANGSTSTLRFLDVFGNAERIRIDANGRVGIGTASPSRTLDVVGDAGISGMLKVGGTFSVVDPNTFGIRFVVASDAKLYASDLRFIASPDNGITTARISSSWSPTKGTGGYLELNDNISTNVVFQANGNSFLTGGKFGIGTSSPSKTLDVVGDAGIGGTLRVGGTFSVLDPNTSGNKFVVSSDAKLYAADLRFIASPENGNTTARISSSWSPTKGTGGYLELNDNFTTNVTFQANGNSFLTGGNFGIGTNTPEKKLDVVGDARIVGTLSVTSVRTTEWNIATPDYVFEPGYNLPSLESVDKHIKTKKHLPDIPSAKELDREGMNLADMNLRLLKKVEELTLYVINQDREIRSLKKTVSSIAHK